MNYQMRAMIREMRGLPPKPRLSRAEYLAQCKSVRAYIAENPGKTREEIEAATGITGTIMTLTTKRLIRQEANPPRYYVQIQ